MSYKPNHRASFLPYLTVRNAQASIDFYTRAFGFELCSEPVVEKEIIIHAELKLHDVTIMLCPEGAFETKKKSPFSTGQIIPVVFYVYVPRVNDFYLNAKQNGAIVISEPQDKIWGDRSCELADIDGYHWSFASCIC